MYSEEHTHTHLCFCPSQSPSNATISSSLILLSSKNGQTDTRHYQPHFTTDRKQAPGGFRGTSVMSPTHTLTLTQNLGLRRQLQDTLYATCSAHKPCLAGQQYPQPVSWMQQTSVTVDCSLLGDKGTRNSRTLGWVSPCFLLLSGGNMSNRDCNKGRAVLLS